MTDITPNDPLLEQLDSAGFVAWLAANNWKRKAHPNERMIVFTGPLDDDGVPLILVLPATADGQDGAGGSARGL